MAVNANSVIPVWVNNFNSEFYTSLTNKEDWSYTNQGLANWQPLFSQLASALNAYRAFNRSEEVYNFMNSSYGYVILNRNFGTDGSLIPNLDAHGIYSLAGFMNTTLARPVTYYDDLVPPVPPETEYVSAKMNADVATVTAAPASETAGLESLQAGTHGTIQQFTNYNLWDDWPPLTGQIVGKPYMKQFFFIDLHWKAVIESLNIGYPIPSGV